MFCPNCGNSNQTDQSFCRACGLNLDAICESLMEQVPSARNAVELRRGRRLERFGDFAWNSFALTVIVTVGAMVYHIATGTDIWFGGFIGALIFFAALGILHRTLAEKHDRGRRRLRGEELSYKRNVIVDAAATGVPGTELFEAKTKELP